MHNRRLALLLVAGLLVTFALSGCGRGSFVTINGEKITKDEFVKKLELAPVNGRPAGLLVMDQMITEKLIDQIAKEQKVEPTEAQINAKIKYLQKDGALNQMLEQRGITIEEFKKELYAQQAVRNIITKGVKVEDKEVRNKYDSVRNTLFTKPENVEIAAVICSKKETIDKAYDQINQGVDFGTVAMRLSEDKLSKQTQGKLGKVWRGQQGVPENLIEIAFKLKVNEVSQPFQVKPKEQAPQWVIVKATEKIAKVVRSFDEVKEQLREEIALAKGQGINDIGKMVQEKRDASTIVVSPERYKQLGKVDKKK